MYIKEAVLKSIEAVENKISNHESKIKEGNSVKMRTFILKGLNSELESYKAKLELSK